MNEPDLYAVFGNPVEHSLSPNIHHAFAAQTHQLILYKKILVPRNEFKSYVQEFKCSGGKGFNITIPFKEEAFALVNKASLRAQTAASVNTIKICDDKTLFGDNTDGDGLVKDICHNIKFNILKKRVLLLGAGGAVRGAIQPLLDQNPEILILANRTKEKAIQLASEFADHPISGCGFEELVSQFDLIINGTSTSLANEVPNIPTSVLGTNTVCYDMVYSAKPTAFVSWAKANSIKHAYDGLGMLVEQAALAFNLWRKIMPETKSVIQAIKQQINHHSLYE